MVFSNNNKKRRKPLILLMFPAEFFWRPRGWFEHPTYRLGETIAYFFLQYFFTQEPQIPYFKQFFEVFFSNSFNWFSTLLNEFGNFVHKFCTNSLHCKTDTEVYRSGCLSNSAFLIAYRNRFAVRHFVRPPFVKFIAIAVWLCTWPAHFLTGRAIFVLNTPCRAKAYGKSLRNRLLICIIGISPLPGTPPAP